MFFLILKIILIIAVTAAAIYVFFIIWRTIKASMDTERLLSDAKPSPALVHKLLRVNFGTANMMTNILLPFNPNRTDGAVPLDTVIVVRGAIAVLHIANLHGYIDNPYKGDWVQYNKGTETTIRNPFERYEGYIAAIRTIMRREEVYNTSIYNIVVYTDKNVKLKNREDQLVRYDRIIPYLKDFQKEKLSTSREVSNIMRVLHKYARKAPPRRRPQQLSAPAQNTRQNPAQGGAERGDK
ncbi:MAG: nuclease-related domain-containing protein [Eubacteriales bacterium]